MQKHCTEKPCSDRIERCRRREISPPASWCAIKCEWRKEIYPLNSENILEMKGIEKSFSWVKALDNVDFLVRKNEVHALMGENGAGKSTLIKILSGIYKKDSGEIFLDGKRIHHQTPFEVQNEGISTIYPACSRRPSRPGWRRWPHRLHDRTPR